MIKNDLHIYMVPAWTEEHGGLLGEPAQTNSGGDSGRDSDSNAI